MATIQCPSCKHETHVPSLEKFTGKNVKCPSCKQAFRVDSSAPLASAIDADDDLKLQAPAQKTPFSPLPHVRKPPPRIPSTETRSSAKESLESLFTPLTYDPNGTTSDKRYPNLLRYIGIAETLTKVFFWIGLVFVALGLVGYEIRMLWEFRFHHIEASLGLMILGLVVAGLYVLILWLLFVFAMAMTEFLRVVIDIENNTRN